MKDFLFIACQHCLPHHLLSRLTGKLAGCRIAWFKNRLIRWFIKRYQVDMDIAVNPDPDSYQHFNDFFTRALMTGQRPIAEGEKVITCPADGCISQIGQVQQGRIFQAKGQEYSLLELVGGDPALADLFEDGSFATVYLSPKDYHRVHMPLAGKLQTMIHIPGVLFSVNDITAERVPRLFTRNERVICLFTTDVGPMVIILIGAMIVASIETVWAGLVAPQKKQVRTWYYTKDGSLTLNKGEEMGRFKLGSTAILLFGKGVATWSAALGAQSAVKMGEAIGTTSL